MQPDPVQLPTPRCQSWCDQHNPDGQGGLFHLSTPDVARDGTMSRTMMRTDADGSIVERPTLLVFPPGSDGDLPLEQ